MPMSDNRPLNLFKTIFRPPSPTAGTPGSFLYKPSWNFLPEAGPPRSGTVASPGPYTGQEGQARQNLREIAPEPHFLRASANCAPTHYLPHRKPVKRIPGLPDAFLFPIAPQDCRPGVMPLNLRGCGADFCRATLGKEIQIGGLQIRGARSVPRSQPAMGGPGSKGGIGLAITCLYVDN
jgi:hypothetical protein